MKVACFSNMLYIISGPYINWRQYRFHLRCSCVHCVVTNCRKLVLVSSNG